MITKVNLKKWRSHEDSEFSFTTGTNALLGILGSGKSSVLDAICFCLFGTFPNLQSRKLKIEDLLMKKPVEASRGEVEVYFADDGKSYSVKRVIERGKGTTYSEVRENGKIIESPNTSRVNELVEKILKVDYDLFSKAIYSEQNSLDYFLTIPRGQRMKKIDELLAIDRFEKARIGSVSLANKLLDKRSAKQSLVESANLADVENLVEELRVSVETTRKEMYQLDSRMKEVSTQREGVERDIGEVRRIKNDLENLRRNEKGITSLIDDTYASLKTLEESLKGHDKEQAEKSLREISRHLSDLETAFRDEQRRYVKLQEQATKARTEVRMIREQKIEILEKELEEKMKAKKLLKDKNLKPEKIEGEIEAKKKLVEKFDAEMEVVRIKVKDLKETIEEINRVESKCPLCDSKITKEKKIMLIKKKKFDIENLKEKFVKAAKNKDITKKQLDELEQTADKLDEMLEAVKDLDKIQTELNNTNNIYAVLKEQADVFERDLMLARKEAESLERKLSEARSRKELFEIVSLRSRDYNERKNKIESLLMQRKQIMSSIKTLESSIVGKENAELENLWKNLVTEEKTIAGKISGMADMIREREIRLKETELKIRGVRKERDEIVKLDKTIEDLKIFEKSLEMTQLQLRKEFIASVNYTMNELWPNLYPYQDFSSLQLSIEEGDYVLQLQEKSGKWVNVEGFASGGERSIAALTLRIAFALVLAPQLKWLVLDEPTANMDTKAVEDLATTLSEHIGDFIEQTFLITHDEKLENAVTGYAYKLERDKAKDGFTRVIQI